MKECLNQKNRKKLENRMLALFGEMMLPLSKEYQMLLADDLVTAFESRFKVLSREQKSMDCWTEVSLGIERQLIET